MTSEQPRSDNPEWRAMLLGTHPGLVWMRRVMRLIPSDPRCKVCLSPHGGIGRPLTKLIGFGRYPQNPQLCNNCFRTARKYPGGAEIELTALFADIRGSTGLAETMAPSAYSGAVERYVRTASRAIREPGGIVQKLLGDGIMALFISSLAGGSDAEKAVAAGRRILREVDLPVGVGVHSGPAWVGFVGGVDDVLDFTALGDAVNVASRLGSDARAGELLVSATTARAAGLDTAAWLGRRIEVRGRSEPIDVWSEQADSEPALA